MSRLLYRLGHFAGRHPWRMLAAWILIAVAAVALSSSLGGATNDTFTLPGSESQRAADALHDRFPQQSVFTAPIDTFSSARAAWRPSMVMRIWLQFVTSLQSSVSIEIVVLRLCVRAQAGTASAMNKSVVRAWRMVSPPACWTTERCGG